MISWEVGLMPRFCPDCGSQLRVGVKFCDKCGAQVQTVAAKQSPNNIGVSNYMIYKSNEVSMAKALLLSFFFSGTGIAYAGSYEKGMIFFVFSFFFFVIWIFIHGAIFLLIYLITWVIGMILTYIEVNKANEHNRMLFLRYNQ